MSRGLGDVYKRQLQDMVTDAVNDALSQIEKVTEQKLGKFTKGLPF